jgi:hypothetical protein
MKAAGWMKGPEEKSNKLGSMNDLSEPLGYRAKMFMKIAEKGFFMIL